jgi:hypothetical protein
VGWDSGTGPALPTTAEADRVTRDITPYICPVCDEEYCTCEDDEDDMYGPCPHGLDPDICSFCLDEWT